MLIITYGTKLAENAYETLDRSDIREYLQPGQPVVLKPNLVVSSPAEEGATTHPEIVEGVILFLKEYGVKDISIIESSWVGDNTKRAFRECGYEELSKRHGIPLYDLKADRGRTVKYGKEAFTICERALDAGFLINIPVLKAHCQTLLTCCMKNLKGCIPDSEKRRYHTLGIDRPVVVLNALLPTGYCIVDGICGDLSFEEGGNPVEANRIIAGRNPLLIDSYCAELIGYQPGEIDYLRIGKELGLGEYASGETKIVELHPESKPVRTAASSRQAERYRPLIREDAACSACYSALIYALHRSGGKVNAADGFHIGQGYRGKSGSGIGIGNCARGFERCVPGCPPKASDIVAFLGK